LFAESTHHVIEFTAIAAVECVQLRQNFRASAENPLMLQAKVYQASRQGEKHIN
jgi:hypothetical protein